MNIIDRFTILLATWGNKAHFKYTLARSFRIMQDTTNLDEIIRNVRASSGSKGQKALVIGDAFCPSNHVMLTNHLQMVLMHESSKKIYLHDEGKR